MGIIGQARALFCLLQFPGACIAGSFCLGWVSNWVSEGERSAPFSRISAALSVGATPSEHAVGLWPGGSDGRFTCWAPRGRGGRRKPASVRWEFGREWPPATALSLSLPAMASLLLLLLWTATFLCAGKTGGSARKTPAHPSVCPLQQPLPPPPLFPPPTIAQRFFRRTLTREMGKQKAPI